MLDLTMQAIQTSLDGLAARQRIIAQNLANSETPGYIAQNVNFEDSLRSAMATRRSRRRPRSRPRTRPTRRCPTATTSTSTRRPSRLDRHRPALPARDAVDEQRVQHPARPRCARTSNSMPAIFPVFDTASSALADEPRLDGRDLRQPRERQHGPAVRPARVPGAVRRGAGAAVEPRRPGRRRRRGRASRRSSTATRPASSATSPATRWPTRRASSARPTSTSART